MKKIFTTLLIVFGCYSLTFAQHKGTVDFGLGVGGGYSVIYQGNDYSDAKLAVNAEAFADFYFSSQWSLKIKAMYDQKGWGNGVLLNNDQPIFTGVDYRATYITVPVMANWHFGHTNNWYLNFGPYAGFLTSAKETDDNIDVKDAFTTVDAGLALGIGVKMPIAKRHFFFIEFDGQSGVTNIFKNSDQSVQNLRESIDMGIAF